MSKQDYEKWLNYIRKGKTEQQYIKTLENLLYDVALGEKNES